MLITREAEKSAKFFESKRKWNSTRAGISITANFQEHDGIRGSVVFCTRRDSRRNFKATRNYRIPDDNTDVQFFVQKLMQLFDAELPKTHARASIIFLSIPLFLLPCFSLIFLVSSFFGMTASALYCFFSPRIYERPEEAQRWIYEAGKLVARSTPNHDS